VPGSGDHATIHLTDRVAPCDPRTEFKETSESSRALRPTIETSAEKVAAEETINRREIYSRVLGHVRPLGEITVKLTVELTPKALYRIVWIILLLKGAYLIGR
jgi:hypothetical protein